MVLLGLHRFCRFRAKELLLYELGFVREEGKYLLAVADVHLTRLAFLQEVECLRESTVDARQFLADLFVDGIFH